MNEEVKIQGESFKIRRNLYPKINMSENHLISRILLFFQRIYF